MIQSELEYDAMLKPSFKVLGTRPIRHDGADKVTGRAIYTADVQMAGMVHGRILRSPHAHAKIKRIDTSKAENAPGVLAVITSADLPELEDRALEGGEGPNNIADVSRNVLARGTVLYRGHAVAAVAARTAHDAEEALKLIEVEYEPLSAVTWVLDAMAADAPLLNDQLFTDELGKKAKQPSNVAKHIRFEKGDIKQGLAAADVVVEREFRLQTVHQGYIEPHATVGLWNKDGRITLWTATQGSFWCREMTAEVLGVPVSQVTVVPCEIGGGFGGKIVVYLEPVAAVLSKKCGRPVKLTMTRAEVFEATGPTPGAFIRVKLGAKKDGTLTAGEAWLAFDAGAFPGSPIGPGCMCVFSCYDLPHAVVDGYDVVLNKPKTQAYRAPGSTHAAFATESVIDELAEKLGIDPVEFRLKNAAKEGTRRVDGPVYPRVGLVECLEAVRDHDHYKSPLKGENRGRGVACGFWFNAGLKSSAAASVNPDGTVTLVEGSTDIGGSRASIAMQLAETLGIAAEEVHPQVGDTDSVGYTDVTGGSRVTYATGMAAYECGLDILRQMKDRAALLWDCKAEEVQFDEGVFRRTEPVASAPGSSPLPNGRGSVAEGRGSEALSFNELAGKLNDTGGGIVGRATVDGGGATNTFGAHIVDLEVDSETGKVSILRYTAVQDTGKAIHPSYVEGQMQGGAVQGIGWALNEEYFYNPQHRMANASFLDYRMPTALDVPMIDTVIVEVPNPKHPFGVRGVGETPIVPPPAAIANAIHRAVGVRMQDLPMSPPKVWKALAGK